MNAAALKLRNAPIVEAVLDIDCDTPTDFDLASIEETTYERLRDRYPKRRKRYSSAFEIEMKPEASSQLSAHHTVQAFQFLHDDEKQLVQVRSDGFSFNRLAPYESLDVYLPEIERTWRAYVEIAAPVETRVLRLRYINRILLPMEGDRVELDEYFKIGPRLADEEAMDLTGFFIRHAAVEKNTGYQINLVLTAQDPDGDKLPVILDISVANPLREEPGNWESIQKSVASLRTLKNRIFQNTLTEKCLQLFR